MPKEPPPDYLALVTYRVDGRDRSGSAVLLDERRLITCYHVVRHRDDPGPVKSVKVALGGVRSVRAKTGPFDKKRDLALLTLDTPVTAFCQPWRSLELREGDPVIVLGFPEREFCKSRHRVFHTNNRRVQLEGDIGAGASGGAMECALHPHYYIGGLVFYETADKTGVIAYDRVAEFCDAHGIALPQATPPPLAAKTYDPEPYRQYLRKETGFIDLGAINVGKDLVFIPIDKLYVPTTMHAGTLENALNANRVAVIQGEAGSGKSTFLKRVAYALVRQDKEQHVHLDFGGLPLWLRITELETFLANSPKEAIPAQKDDFRVIPLCLADLAAAQKLGLDAGFFERELDNPGSPSCYWTDSTRVRATNGAGASPS